MGAAHMGDTPTWLVISPTCPSCGAPATPSWPLPASIRWGSSHVGLAEPLLRGDLRRPSLLKQCRPCRAPKPQPWPFPLLTPPSSEHMTGRGPVPSQGSSREGAGPLYPDRHCHQVFQQEPVCSLGLPLILSCFISLNSQPEYWMVLPQSTSGETEALTWKSPAPVPQLPQSPCSAGPALLLCPQAFPAGETERAFRAGRRRSLGCLRLLWAHGFLGAAQNHTQSWEERGTATRGFVCQASTGLIPEA